jgi:hypothetical protein
MGTSFLVCNMRAEVWFVPLDENSVKWHTKRKGGTTLKVGVPPMQLVRSLTDLAIWHQSRVTTVEKRVSNIDVDVDP